MAYRKSGYTRKPTRAKTRSSGRRSGSSYGKPSRVRSGGYKSSSNRGNVLRIELAPGLSAGSAPFGSVAKPPAPPRGRRF